MAKQNTKPGPSPSPASKPPNTPASAVESKPHPKAAGPVSVTREAIAQAAYLRWQKSGGDAEANWLAAERELMGR